MKAKPADETYLFSNQDLKRLILPLLVEQLLAITVGMADSIMVSSVGEAAVSGVSLVDTIFVLLINIFTALATGGAVVCGQYLGKKRPEQACQAADQLVLATGILSILVMGLMYVLRTFILNVVFGHIEPDVWNNCNIYFLIVSASIPFISIYNAGAAIFRAQGDSKTPMKISLLMNVINIIGNGILLYGFHFGVEGAAIPTLVSRMFAAVVILARAYKTDHVLHLTRPVVWKLHWPTLKKILRIGVPNGLENSMFQLGKILVLSIVTGFGTASIAANAVSNNVATFAVLPGMSIGFALLTVGAQCVGANDFEQVHYYTKKLMKVAYISLIGINILLMLVMPFIIRAYGLSAEASGYAYKILIYHSICVVTIWPLSFSLPNTLRAAADVRFTMLLAIVSMWIFRIGFSVLLGVKLHWGVFGVWVAMTIDWLFRAVCFTIRYIRGKWQHQSLV